MLRESVYRSCIATQTNIDVSAFRRVQSSVTETMIQYKTYNVSQQYTSW